MKQFSIIAFCTFILSVSCHAQDTLLTPAASSSNQTGGAGRSLKVAIPRCPVTNNNLKFTIQCGGVLQNDAYKILSDVPVFMMPAYERPVDGLAGVSTQGSANRGFAIPIILGGTLLAGTYLLKERKMLNAKWEQVAWPLAGIGCMFIGDWWGTFGKSAALNFARQIGRVSGYQRDLENYSAKMQKRYNAREELIRDSAVPTHQLIKRLASTVLMAHRANRVPTGQDSFE